MSEQESPEAMAWCARAARHDRVLFAWWQRYAEAMEAGELTPPTPPGRRECDVCTLPVPNWRKGPRRRWCSPECETKARQAGEA
ncbi:hypothetical protein ACT1U9_01975 [Streptomyces sp. BR1]|uniref:hypothetical protein n=1 Tax=Streptomyces sp. BR1 TaxID=1592323 RepID=UPI00402B7C9B